MHNDGGKYLSSELLREVSFQKRLDPGRKRELTDFLNEVLASHCFSNGHPCKVLQVYRVPSLLGDECEFIMSLCQCIVYLVWVDVSHTINDRVKWCFGSYVLSCQLEHALLGFLLFVGLLE